MGVIQRAAIRRIKDNEEIGKKSGKVCTKSIAKGDSTAKGLVADEETEDRINRILESFQLMPMWQQKYVLKNFDVIASTNTHEIWMACKINEIWRTDSIMGFNLIDWISQERIKYDSMMISDIPIKTFTRALEMVEIADTELMNSVNKSQHPAKDNGRKKRLDNLEERLRNLDKDHILCLSYHIELLAAPAPHFWYIIALLRLVDMDDEGEFVFEIGFSDGRVITTTVGQKKAAIFNRLMLEEE